VRPDPAAQEVEISMKIGRILVIGGMMAAFHPAAALAHCDALDGPVVQAARSALERRDVTPALRWVLAEREAEVRDAFNRTLQVRPLGADAQALAETWFFETLVRLHRAGEGEPFDGLKPAGHIEPLVAMVDGTLEKGTVDGLMSRVAAHVTTSVTERFERARAARARADDSIEAGRTYVAAYVEYLHHVEALHRAANGASRTGHASGHEPQK
jgi:hypothetical protein